MYLYHYGSGTTHNTYVMDLDMNNTNIMEHYITLDSVEEDHTPNLAMKDGSPRCRKL